MNICVLGAGGWGTALGLVLEANSHRVTFWGHNPDRLLEMKRAGENKPYLPGVALPSALRYEPDLSQALCGAEAAVVAVPSKGIAELAESLSGYAGLLVSVTKGIDYDTGFTMCQILGEKAPKARIAALSGPTLAPEVARGVPSAIVAASRSSADALEVQHLFHRPTFRVYTSVDLIGVELGGALKNVIAIAAGVGDGLGFGDNTKAALVTRAIVEIKRLGVACSALPETFAGLSGLGDLTLTCFSRLSRNRGFGERLGRGETLEDILGGAHAVAEGHPTARSAFKLAQHKKISVPIIEEVYAMLYQKKNVAQAVRDLTTRESKAED